MSYTFASQLRRLRVSTTGGDTNRCHQPCEESMAAGERDLTLAERVLLVSQGAGAGCA